MAAQQTCTPHSNNLDTREDRGMPYKLPRSRKAAIVDCPHCGHSLIAGKRYDKHVRNCPWEPENRARIIAFIDEHGHIMRSTVYEKTCLAAGMPSMPFLLVLLKAKTWKDVAAHFDLLPPLRKRERDKIENSLKAAKPIPLTPTNTDTPKDDQEYPTHGWKEIVTLNKNGMAQFETVWARIDA